MAIAGLHWHNTTQPAAMTHPPRWTQPEIDHLEQLAGDVPFQTLLRSMHYMATADGWPPSTAAPALANGLPPTAQGSCWAVPAAAWKHG